MTIIRSVRRSGPLLLVVAAMLLTFAGSATATKLITGKQVKNGSVTGVDVRDQSVTGRSVTDGSLAFGDLDIGVNRLAAPDGPQGEAGPKGPQGQRGVPGMRGRRYVISEPFSLPSGGEVINYATCPLDQRALQGGISSTGGTYGPALTQSSPTSDGRSWAFHVVNDSVDDLTLYLWAVCIDRDAA